MCRKIEQKKEKIKLGLGARWEKVWEKCFFL
jgi:hypothetical protein